MYQLLRNRSLGSISIDTAPPLLLALFVAELFFKWHSFSLECTGFLATWFALDWAWSRLRGRAAPKNT